MINFYFQVAAAAAWQEGCETDNENSDTDSAKCVLPKVVGLGLRAVFDMIKETETSHPLICQRGLSSLLDVLQGLQPEDLRDEPESVMETMFTSLLELASRPGAPISINGNVEQGGHIRASNFLLFMTLRVGWLPAIERSGDRSSERATKRTTDDDNNSSPEVRLTC